MCVSGRLLATPGNGIVAFMRTVALVGSAILPLALWLSVWASPVAACNGGDARLATGVRGATSIFYARIAGASESSVGFYDLRLKVGSVIRGSGKSHVVRVINPRVCNALKVGDFGVVVIGSVDPYGVGPNDIYNFFYVLGPGGTSASMAATVLSDLPNTETTISPGVDDPGRSGAWLAVLGVSTVATLSYLRRRHVVLTSQVRVAP